MTDYLCPNCGPSESCPHSDGDGGTYIGCDCCGDPVELLTPLIEAYKALKAENETLMSPEIAGVSLMNKMSPTIGYVISNQKARIAALKAENEYLKSLLREPVGELKGALPVVVYFANESDREGFIDAVKEAMPNAIAKKF